MAVFKCKMCGGSLEVQEGMSVCECGYCGTMQTLPKIGDQRRANLYDRANHFRRNNEFDKAMSMYEQILEEDKEDAEAYWSLVLCTYGIEYVEDPASHIRKPTVNRTQFTSVFADENYKAALQYADEAQRQLYEEEAKQIDGIQKGILDISNQEAPFDVFICYKETDAEGRRTQDSVLANDLYHQLTQEGFKVFFARITLEDKLGSAYEPYIFAALNSAKVMVVLGTRPEYFNAVWVKNEWSRYLSLIKGGAKKVLIPAYKDMDPYDLPQEFSHLQSQDMGKLGFMQDLIRGIKKLTGTAQPIQSAAAVGTAGNETAPLLKRAFLFLEDGDFVKADEYCERVLNLEPENAEAYMGKLMAQLKVRKRENLAQSDGRLDQTDAYQKIMRFGGEAIKSEAEGYNRQILKRLKEEEERQQKLKQEQEAKRREETYQGALAAIESAVTSRQLKAVMNSLQALGDYKDAAARIAAAAEKLSQFQKREQAKRKRLGFMAAVAVVAFILIGAVFSAIDKQNHQNAIAQQAAELLQNGNYEGAYQAFAMLMNEEKAKEKVAETMTSLALGYIEDEAYDSARALLRQITDYTDDTTVSDRLREAMIQAVERHAEAGEYDELKKVFSALDDTARTAAEERLSNAIYQAETQCLKEGKYAEAEGLLSLMKKNGMQTDRLSVKELQLSLAQAEIGDTVTFGEYRLYTDTFDRYGVKWYVLDKKESGEVLLWCTESLTCMDNEEGGWKDSALRKWLNNDFYQTCFSREERAVIAESVLQNEQISGGYVGVSEIASGEGVEKQLDETKDRVFLLSASEFVQYMKKNTNKDINDDRANKAYTAYAKEKTMEMCNIDQRYSYQSDKFPSYFLRSIYVGRFAEPIQSTSYTYNKFGQPTQSSEIISRFGSASSASGVRPAIWVKTIE